MRGSLSLRLLLLRACVREISAHRLRSFLTMLGIIVGISTLVLSLGVMEGMFKTWKSYIEEFGGLQKLSVVSIAPPSWQAARAPISPGRTTRDAESLQKLLGAEAVVSCETVIADGFLLYNGIRQHTTKVTGVLPEYFEVERYRAERGRLITALDVKLFHRVVVLGRAPADALFRPDEDPIGKYVRINGVPFKVVGLLPLYDYFRGANPARYAQKNRIAIIPISTAQKCFVGHTRVNELNIAVRRLNTLELVVQKIENTLLPLHYGIWDFGVATRGQELDGWRKTERSFTFGFGLLIVICLFVGGIGIMNVMFASINERVREIGIRKSLGANSLHIFAQILTESILLSLLGGVIGIGVSVATIPFIGNVLPEGIPGRPVLLGSAVGLGFAFSVCVGIFAGLVPAIKASRLNPVDALRHD